MTVVETQRDPTSRVFIDVRVDDDDDVTMGGNDGGVTPSFFLGLMK